MNELLYAYYGDDFTGSTDVLESLALAGMRAVLFLGSPSRQHLESFRDCDAIGIAGDSRSQTPEWMSSHLPPLFETLKSFGARIAHYKTCSTFDSSPNRGNIGRAIEIGLDIFQATFIPIVVGAPHLGRFVVFGNLFAVASGTVYRIDRHPTMSCHPVTPMIEADLRTHLASQTEMPIGLLEILALKADANTALAEIQAATGPAVLFDGLDQETLEATGALIWQRASEGSVFAVGSSGLTECLISAWKTEGIARIQEPQPAASVEQVLVISGSCSPVTAAQIRWALASGFAGIAIDPATLMDPATSSTTADLVIRDSLRELRTGQSVILYTALGPLGTGIAPHDARLGEHLGRLLKSILGEYPIQRIVICGGDTASHAAQQLDIFALTWSAALEPGAPICRAHSDDPTFRNLELILKGGQIGKPDFFGLARGGGRAPLSSGF